MAAQDYFGAVQQLYISYFGRPADPSGLQNMAAALDAIGAPKEFGALQQQVQADRAGTTALSRLVNTFNTSAESNALYGTGTSVADIQKFVAAIYQNVLGREADIGGFNFWVGEITAGRLTKANAAASITAAAMTNTTAQGLLDKATVEKKLAVANAFTTALDTPTEIISYSGDAAAAAARSLLGAVNNNTVVADYQSTVTASIENIVAIANPGQTFALTANIDNFVGTNGNDTFSATITSTSNPIGSLDVIDGGAGRDVFNIADSATATGAGLAFPTITVRNIETLNVATSGGLGNGAAFDISGASFTNANLTAAGTANSVVTAAASTNVNLTVGGAADATVNGGRNVTVNAGTGDVVVAGGTSASVVTVNGGATSDVSGRALSNVTVNGGIATINNTAASGNGTTLTAVTLKGVTGANSVTGDAVTTVNLSSIVTAGTGVTVNNAATGGHTLNVNATGSGYTAAGADATVTVTDATATRVNVTAATASNVTLVAAAATAATVAGAGNVELDLAGAGALTSLESTATGTVELVLAANSGLVSIKGGAGSERFTTTQSAKVTFDLGAGNDVVTLGSAIAAGSTINLGAGNDSLLLGAGGSVAASTSTATTIIDGGEGFDIVSAALINAGNAGQFRNFEALDMSASATLDVALVTGSTITGLTLTGGTGTSTLNNVAAGVGLTVSGANTGVKTINLANTSGTADTFGITFAGEAAASAPSAANVTAGTVTLNGVEAVNIASAGAANTWNSVTLADTNLRTVTITGDKNLDLALTGTVGATGTGNGVSSIDGSAATGKLAINVAGAGTLNVAAAGLTIKGGTAGDTITLGNKAATVDAGAGDDIIVTGSAGGTLTGGAGKDVFNVSASVATGVTEATSVLTTITDFAAGDSINLGLTGAAATVTKLTLGASVTTLESALQAAGAATEGVVYFQYGNNTYLFADKGTAGFDAGDVVVKLTGNIDLSTATMTSGGIVTL